MNFFVVHPEQCLSTASHFFEVPADESNDFLNSRIRIKAHTAVAVPEKGDRHRNPKLATACLSTSRFHQPISQRYPSRIR